MYQDLKLEKGMYHITGKSFSEVLEGMDPSGAYAETPLAGLDAYERQLKRFDIHVSGSHCDRVEKFFSTTDSAVLFPSLSAVPFAAAWNSLCCLIWWQCTPFLPPENISRQC